MLSNFTMAVHCHIKVITVVICFIKQNDAIPQNGNELHRKKFYDIGPTG